MKKIVKLMLVIVAVKINAQWTKVSSENVGATGQIGIHASTVFVYGYNASQFVLRSSDNGTTWNNIANKFPDKVYYVHGHGDYVFAIVGINSIYYSTDDGITWSLRSNISYPNGAVLMLVSDGNTLYAVSNRNVVFKSVDNGLTWTQITINHSQSQVFGLDFAVAGNTMVFCALNLGAFISTDAGANWVLKNPPIIIGTVQTHNNEVYGTTYGMYKLVNTDWLKLSNGFPSGLGVSASTRSSVSIGSKIFTYYADAVSLTAKIFISENNGLNWTEVSGAPTAVTSSINNFMAVSQQYLYLYVYSIFSPANSGVYRYQISNISSVNDDRKNFGTSFALDQNYPNPFSAGGGSAFGGNPSTTIKYSIPAVILRQAQDDNVMVSLPVGRHGPSNHDNLVTLKVYDILGREVATLVNEHQPAGNYEVKFDGSNLSSGIYFYRLQSGSFVQKKKFLLMK